MTGIKAVKRIKVGIMPREEYQQRMIDIAAGRYTPKRGEPKVWFHSMKSMSEVLSDKNVELLKIIREQAPETISELADLSDRKTSNLSRTLKTLEHYGIVKMERHNRSKRPVAMAASFDIHCGVY